jgi:hypothetical protein
MLFRRWAVAILSPMQPKPRADTSRSLPNERFCIELFRSYVRDQKQFCADIDEIRVVLRASRLRELLADPFNVPDDSASVIHDEKRTILAHCYPYRSAPDSTILGDEAS